MQNEFQRGARALADIIMSKLKCVEANIGEYKGYIDDNTLKLLEEIIASEELPAALLYEKEKETIADEPEVATNLP